MNPDPNYCPVCYHPIDSFGACECPETQPVEGSIAHVLWELAKAWQVFRYELLRILPPPPVLLAVAFLAAIVAFALFLREIL